MEKGIRISQYANNNRIYIGIIDEEGLPYCDLTVNLTNATGIKPFDAFVDINNFPDAMMFIHNYKLGTYTGIWERSGYVRYPLYSFDPERLKELAPKDFANLKI